MASEVELRTLKTLTRELEEALARRVTTEVEGLDGVEQMQSVSRTLDEAFGQEMRLQPTRLLKLPPGRLKDELLEMSGDSCRLGGGWEVTAACPEVSRKLVEKAVDEALLHPHPLKSKEPKSWWNCPLVTQEVAGEVVL